MHGWNILEYILLSIPFWLIVVFLQRDLSLPKCCQTNSTQPVNDMTMMQISKVHLLSSDWIRQPTQSIEIWLTFEFFEMTRWLHKEYISHFFVQLFGWCKRCVLGTYQQRDNIRSSAFVKGTKFVQWKPHLQQ